LLWALAGTSQISVLLPDGTEEARYSGPADNPGGSPDPMPWANPANIAFDDQNGALLVTNHASLGVSPHRSPSFDFCVDDKGGPGRKGHRRTAGTGWTSSLAADILGTGSTILGSRRGLS